MNSHSPTSSTLVMYCIVEGTLNSASHKCLTKDSLERMQPTWWMLKLGEHFQFLQGSESSHLFPSPTGRQVERRTKRLEESLLYEGYDTQRGYPVDAHIWSLVSIWKKGRSPSVFKHVVLGGAICVL